MLTIQKKQAYLGTTLPKRVEEIKKDFLASIYGEKWLRTIDRIRENYTKETTLMPKSAMREEPGKFSVRSLTAPRKLKD